MKNSWKRIAFSAGVLLVRANVVSSRSFIRPAVFDLQEEWTVGVGGQRLGCLCADRFLGAIKIKDGGHNFRYKNTEHSLAKITPALQARKRMVFLQTLKILWVAIDCNFFIKTEPFLPYCLFMILCVICGYFFVITSEAS